MARMPHRDGSITMQWGKGEGTGGVTEVEVRMETKERNGKRIRKQQR